jgi:hypothetical protein
VATITRLGRLLIVLLAAWLTLAPVPRTTGITLADEPIAATEEPEVAPRVTDVNRLEKQKKAYSGLAALAGIIITGIALAALIILWAGRLRRQIRRPLTGGGEPSRDFWFLKPPKPIVTETSLPTSHLPGHDTSPDTPPDNSPPSR